MDSFSPRDIARIQRRFRRFNSTGASDEFTPPQNTPPSVPVVDLQQRLLHNPQPVRHQTIPEEDGVADIERKFKLMEIKEKIAMVPIPDDVIEMLKQFQVEHVQNLIYALKKYGVALDASDTGTGKTYAAIAIAAALGLNVIVVCPKSVIPNWHNVCAEFDVEQSMIVNYESLKNGKYYVTLGDFLDEVRTNCPYIEFIRDEILDPMTLEPILTASGRPKTRVVGIEWSIPNNTLVIFDEAHNSKNGMNNSIPTINSRMMIMSRPQFDTQRNTFGLCLSATITDKLENFDVIGYMLGLFPRYSKKSYQQFSRKLPNEHAERIQSIHNILYPARASRMNIRKIKELTGDSQFKKNDIKAKTYELDADACDEIEAAHESIRRAMIALRNKQNVDGEHPLTVILRQRQRIELLKIPIFVEKIRKHIQRNKSVTVFVNFKETLDTIAQQILTGTDDWMGMLPDEFDFIRGGQTSDEREEIRKKFQNDELRLLICNIDASREGISLHDIHGVYSRRSLISPTWNGIRLKQVFGRGYRANAKSDMVQRVIYVKSENGQPAIEQMMCDNMNETLKNIALLNEGDLQEYENIGS